jgi:hypothetical protein
VPTGTALALQDQVPVGLGAIRTFADAPPELQAGPYAVVHAAAPAVAHWLTHWPSL